MKAIKKAKTASRAVNSDRVLYEICKGLKKLLSLGKTEKQIEAVLNDMRLPLKYHLFITGNFSALMDLKYN